MKLLAATHNKHKLKEIKHILPDFIELLSLDDIKFFDEIPEDSDTFLGNAKQKARYVYHKTGLHCFADDSGLEVDALNGQPGIYSARYAGEHANYANNNSKLLSELKDVTNRKANFITVIALILGEKEYYFEGIVNGRIINEVKGIEGFGYDPLFIPEGYDQTFAELPLHVKNQISHRARAFQEMTAFLSESALCQ